MRTYQKISARRKWLKIALWIAIPVGIVLAVPYTRTIVIGYVSGEALTSDYLPVSHHTRRLLKEDPLTTYDSLKELLGSEQCAVEAAPELVVYFQGLRKQGKKRLAGTSSMTADLLKKCSKVSVKVLAPVLGEMLICEVDDDSVWEHVSQVAILEKAVWANADHESIRAASAKMLWDRVAITVSAGAKTLNHFDKKRLKEETLKMLQSNDQVKPLTACGNIVEYCPDLVEAIPDLEKLGKSSDSFTANSAHGALGKIREYKETQH